MSKRTLGTVNYSNRNLPDCSGYSAYVLPGAFYGEVVALMAEAGFQKADNVEAADVVVFIGGADIDPALYNDKKHFSTSFNINRDIFEVGEYRKAVLAQKVCFGICRGAQLLHALNGGKLWQDVNNHAGRDHFVVDIEDDVRFLATSIHHQMLKMNDKMTLVAVTEDQCATRFSDGSMSVFQSESDHILEVEAGIYEETGCFFVQGHPEVGIDQYRSWCMNKLYDFMQQWELKLQMEEKAALDTVTSKLTPEARERVEETLKLLK